MSSSRQTFATLTEELKTLGEKFEALSTRCVKSRSREVRKLVIPCDWVFVYLDEIHVQLCRYIDDKQSHLKQKKQTTNGQQKEQTTDD